MRRVDARSVEIRAARSVTSTVTSEEWVENSSTVPSARRSSTARSSALPGMRSVRCAEPPSYSVAAVSLRASTRPPAPWTMLSARSAAWRGSSTVMYISPVMMSERSWAGCSVDDCSSVPASASTPGSPPASVPP